MLSAEHEAIVERGLSALPPTLRDDAQKYIESRLRPIREVEATDVRAAVGAALQRYRQ